MQKANFLFLIISMVLFTGCAVTNYNPSKKFTKQELQQDYSLLRDILEKKHPALYWYTTKDSMNYYFDSLYNHIGDSMTELQFGWKILAPLTQKVRCGHTSVGMSKKWGRFIRNKGTPSFPLLMRVWGDTMVVTANLNRKDSLIKRGMLITSINGIRNKQLVQKMFEYLPLDGYADNVNFTRLSSNFPFYHRNIFGIYKNYRVQYIDSTGKEKSALLPLFTPITDSARKQQIARQATKPKKLTSKQRRLFVRSLEIDSTGKTATMSLNTFSKADGIRLRIFIKESFRKLRQQQVQNLVLDLRSNGGGDVGMYVLLTKFIRKTKFKVADTSYAVTKSLRPYTKYINHGLFNNIGLFFMTKKQKDNLYHFGYYERHYFKPRERNHFDGDVYVLTNGPTFSASTLFCNAVKGQENVTLVGEETGGGWHGNSGLLIPDITLPITKLRVRLPLFKLVQYNHVPKNGRGVVPDIYVLPTVEGVRKGIDRKMEMVMEMINAKPK